jgi:hypothetical protein
VYSCLPQLQPKLNALYTGPDSLFSKMMVCANCTQIATEPRDCPGCHKIICDNCVTTDKSRVCGNCSTPFGEATLHPVVKEISNRATFRCIFDCGESALKYSEILSHITESCPKRTMQCPNHCEVMPFSADELDAHLSRCPLETVTCTVCQERRMPRKDMQRHIENDCPKGHQECKRCHGIYQATKDHDCISQLYKLIMETRDMGN